MFYRTNNFRYSKLNSPDFWKVVKDEKIFCLLETHHTADDTDSLEIPGYKCFSLCRPKSKGVKYKPSGGIAVYVHSSVKGGVSKLPTSGTENVILKLKQDFFGLEKDVQLIFSYCVPANSSYRVKHQLEVFVDLEEKLRSLPSKSNIIVLGDLNSRTGDKKDYIEDEDNTNIPVPDCDLYHNDTVATFPRNNTDTGHNEYGDRLIELCRSVPLRICNGRKLGDLLGSPTCFRHNGLSSVDYGLASPDLYDQISAFSVHNPLPTISDHAPISMTLSTNIQYPNHNEQPKCKFINKPKKIIWDKTKSTRFELLLQSPECKKNISDFINSGLKVGESAIDAATHFIADIIVSKAAAADMSVKSSPVSRSKTCAQRKVSHPKWHDDSCHDAFRKVKATAALLKKDPKNAWLRGKLSTENKQYLYLHIGPGSLN